MDGHIACILCVLLAAVQSVAGAQDCDKSAVIMMPQERCLTGKIHTNHMLKGGLWKKNFVYLGQTANIAQCVQMVCSDITTGFAFLLNGSFCYSITCLEKCEVDTRPRGSGKVSTVTVELKRKVFFANETQCLRKTLSADSPQPSGEYKILRDIIRNSQDIDVRPLLSERDRINMTISIRLVQILDIDEIGQTITLNVWTTQSWDNPLLRWKETEYDNITSVNVEPNMVWTPGVVLHNNAGDQPSGIEKQKTKVIIESNGRNLWYATTLLKSQCKINTRYFPFDEQICYLRLSSWTLPYRKFDLSYSLKEKPLDHYINNSEWEVMSFTVSKSLVFYPCCTEPFAEVLYRLHIQRKTLYYIYTMIVPCTVVTALVAIGFFLPPSSGERIALNVTILVAITVYLNIASKKLPTTSENIPLLSTFYLLMVIQVVISIMATAVVLRFHFRGSMLGKMPKWIRYFVIDCLGKVLCGSHYQDIQKSKQEAGASRSNQASRSSGTYVNGSACRSLDRGRVRSRPVSAHGKKSSRSMEAIPCDPTEHENGFSAENNAGKRPIVHRMDYQMRCMSVYQIQRDNKQQVNQDITAIVRAEKTKQTKRDQLNEWQFAAMVVDRLFFLLSLIAVVACTSIMMLRPRIPVLGTGGH